MSSKPIDKSFLRLVPSLLDDFESPYSLVSDFARQRHLYYPDKDFPRASIYQFAKICIEAAQSLQYHITEFYGRKTGINPILFYLLECGTKWFESQDSVETALALRSRYRFGYTRVTEAAISVVGQYFVNKKVPLPMGPRRWNFQISPTLFSQVSTISDGLGISKSEFITLSIMHALSESPHTHEGHITKMESCVEEFMTELEEKNSSLEVLLNHHQFPPLPPERD